VVFTESQELFWAGNTNEMSFPKTNKIVVYHIAYELYIQLNTNEIFVLKLIILLSTISHKKSVHTVNTYEISLLKAN
jgi:hypothetical protein